MKKVIAYKKQSAGIIFIICTIFWLLILIKALESNGNDILFILIFSALSIIALIGSVHFLLLPSKLIILTNHQILILPKGITIPLNSIKDVSCKRFTLKGCPYRWGSVTILTDTGKHKIHYVADCQNVTIQLNKLVRKAKRNRD